MAAFWIVLFLVIAIILGNALMLLRTARKPKIPPSVQAKPYRDDEEEW